ncbi:GH25 family lysozyme [Bacteroides nordii]|uniref:GH25 family lysozyme n=1 Tax=Bacteroides nordii TaxID=291645 RepID=UPI0024201621|nr:GH25 family lysozyme [Bacteroides nordii]
MKKSFSFLPYIRVVLAALCNLALSYLLFMICRFVFLWVNYSYYSELTGTELMTILKGGLVFDTSAIVYINALYILLMFFPLHYKEYKRYQQVTKGVFVFTNSIALIMNLMDTVYFQFTNRRTTASVFNEFSNENNIAGIIGVELLNHWYLTLLAVVLIYGMFKLYRKPFGKSENLNPWGYYGIQLVCLVAVIPFCIFGMRGGIGAAVRPITVSNANQYVNRPIETGLVLNTPFAMIRTIGKKPFVVPAYYKDEAAMEAVYTPVHTPADSVQFRPLNVVVFIMESFGKEYIGALNKDLDGGAYKGYPPFLDSLISESLTFEYSFANGHKSIDGMPSVLSGIPMFVEPFFLTPASMNKVSGIGGELRKKGYYTAFFHGAENGSNIWMYNCNNSNAQKFKFIKAEQKTRVIDVSYHQGQIDWNKVYNTGIYGVMLRIGYWNTEDGRLSEYINEVKRLGIPYGIYIFSYANTTNGANIEANFTKSIISKYNLNPTLGIYYDLEDWYISADNTSNTLSKDQYDNIARTYINSVSGYVGSKYKVKVYADLNHVNNRFGSYARGESDWIAHYNASECGYKGSYSLWQYTSSGTVDGIRGYVDLNYLY